jgi:NADH-quinone oxidoreductase subunit N
MSIEIDLRPLWPAIIVAVAGMAVLLVQAFGGRDRDRQGPSVFVSLVGLGGALAAVVLVARGHGLGQVVGGAYAADPFSLFFQALILGSAVVAVLLSPGYLRATGVRGGEYYALLMFCVVGMLGLVSCTELVSLFVALEIMSVALYAMAGLHRDREESTESAMKYFITGAFSSAFLLYGIALLYGVSGSTTMSRIAGAVAARSVGEAALLPLVGLGLLLVGFGFKVASVPFHMWAPDVYEGAPTTVTAVMAAGVKAAAFGAFIRVLLQAVPSLAAQWRPAVAVLALLTVVIGNLGALAQTNVKRLLAFSSVAHAGYLLTALVAAPGQGAEAVLFYLVAYAAVNLGGFGALAALARDGREPLALTDLNGLAQRRPVLAAAMTLFLISLTGVPVSAGFVGKFYLFTAAVNAGYVGLAIVGVLASVISAYYYLRIAVAMYMRDPVGEDGWSRVGVLPAAALAASSAVVLALGVYPGPLLDAARTALRSLL